MICPLCGRERGEPNMLGKYGGPNVCMWTESAECESVRVAYRRALWMVAIGCEWVRSQSECMEHSLADVWYAWMRDKALRALSQLGDEDARRMIGGGS